MSVSESIDALRTFGIVDVLDREQLRAALAATTVKRQTDRTPFDVLYDMWFPTVLGARPGPSPVPEDGPFSAPGDSPATIADVRDRVTDYLRIGDPAGLSRLAMDAVEVFGRAETQPGQQAFFSYRVMRALGLDALMNALLDAMLAGQPRGGLTEAVTVQSLASRRGAFEAAVATDVRRRIAEQRGLAAAARFAIRPPIDQVDFLRARSEDVEALRRIIRPLARRLATRLAAKRRPGHSGRLDFRRTIRASMATGGVPLDTRLRARRPHKPELVILCDVSGSVAAFAQFTVLLTYALQEQFTKVRTFAFVDTCDEVTRCFDQAPDPAQAVARMAREAQLVWFDGHSDYGHSFEIFEERFGAALTPGASLLVLGDARNNYRSPGLPTFKRMVGAVRHAYWLNPEPRSTWQTADSLALDYAQHIEMVECRNAAALERFVRRLLPA